MRIPFKILGIISVCAVFYAGAFFIMQGVNEFERRGNEALFTAKAEMAAIDNTEAAEATPAPTPQTTPNVWK